MSSPALKTSLDPATQSLVDSTLKRAKQCSRRLSAAATAFEDEFRVLERIYYKGKNQHRMAFFWRNVQEMRRFCSRLIRADLNSKVNELRHAFYQSTDFHNLAILKSSWTYLPDTKYLRLFNEQLVPILKLLHRIQETFQKVYCSLKSTMQTGAFLQLILTLIAIVSRLYSLTELFLEVHQDLTTTLLGLCTSLDSLLGTVTPAVLYKASEAEQMALRDDILVEHDLLPSPRISMMKQSDRSNGNAAGRTEAPRCELPRIVKKMDISIKSEARGLEVLSNSTVPAQERSKETKVKKKRKRVDEIDAIFGF